MTMNSNNPTKQLKKRFEDNLQCVSCMTVVILLLLFIFATSSVPSDDGSSSLLKVNVSDEQRSSGFENEYEEYLYLKRQEDEALENYMQEYLYDNRNDDYNEPPASRYPR